MKMRIGMGMKMRIGMGMRARMGMKRKMKIGMKDGDENWDGNKGENGDEGWR